MEYIYNWINNNTEIIINIEIDNFRYIDIITIDNIYYYKDSIELTNNNITITMELNNLTITPAGMVYIGEHGNKVIFIPVDNDNEF